MKIVIISGTMYPHISARSFRTTELAKGLAKMGHDVSLYTILGQYDYSQMEKEFPNLHIKSMGKSHFGNINSDGVLKKNIVQRVLTRLLYNVVDYPRCEYLFKAYNVLKKECEFDFLITIAHPYGVHWGTAFYKKKHPGKFKKWISDCGDPFMGDPDVKRWRLIQEPLERFWCKQTDMIAIPVENGKTGYYKEFRDKIVVIPQGIDFDSIEIDSYEGNDIPTFLYSGAVYPGMRDPREFLEYLSQKDIPFRFYIYAPSDTIFEDFKDVLGDRLIMNRYIPRKDLIRVMSKVDFLVNINNESSVQTPSKLIDYSLSKRPILNISTHFTEQERISLDAFLKGDYSSQYIVPNVEQYDAKNVSKKFIEAYDSIR